MTDGQGQSDGDLWRAYCAGDDGAFGVLYGRYREWAFRVACRVARDEGEAADAVQEAFIYLVKHRKRLVVEGKLTTILYRAVRSAAATLRRKSRRLRFGESGESERDAALPRAGVDEELARVLEALPVGQREVLLMRVVDGMSVEEVARALEVPEGTVKSRLHGAVKALEDALREPE